MLDEVTLNFWNDAEVLVEVARCYEWYGRYDLALRRLDRALELQPDQPDILFFRAELHHRRGNPTGEIADLIRHLRLLKNVSPMIDLEPVVSQLLNVSLDTFVEALPLVLERISPSQHLDCWLHLAGMYLIHQRRWDDACRYLEITAKTKMTQEYGQDSGAEGSYANSYHAFYLAMAKWGKTGNLDRGLCEQALAYRLPPSTDEKSEELDAFDFQCLSLLWWGVGDSAKASGFLDRALESLEARGLPGVHDRSFWRSYWTFDYTTPLDFRSDCEEMHRMFQGEPLRPAFLGPPPSPAAA